MIPSWPVTLPKFFDENSYSESFGGNNLRTEMDIGIAKVRPRSLRTPRNISGNLFLSSAQLQALKSFYQSGLLNGSSVFLWHEPIRDSESELTSIVARFLSAPSITSVRGKQYVVSVQIEILP